MVNVEIACCGELDPVIRRDPVAGLCDACAVGLDVCSVSLNDKLATMGISNLTRTKEDEQTHRALQVP